MGGKKRHLGREVGREVGVGGEILELEIASFLGGRFGGRGVTVLGRGPPASLLPPFPPKTHP